ncbi:MAG TPA: RHS repeat-associated core domain-containing protein, partial [Bacteroidia bacterium]|nr:RHS repeat-associated core domain-containing protein [Bacteroidia bacterium]
SVKVSEWDMYGSSRIGTLDTALLVYPRTPLLPIAFIFNPYDTSRTIYTEGQKQYELTNHLGNVFVTLSDKKIPVDTITSGTTADYYLPIVITSQDYYAFGMLMPGRNFNTTGFRFGFNGKEKTDELYGVGNAYDYGMRMYSARLGRPLSTDPLFKKFPMLSPYQFFSDNPIKNIDLDGLEGVPSHLLANGGYTTAIMSVWHPKAQPHIDSYYNGTISAYIPNFFEKVETKLNSPSTNPISYTFKAIGKMSYSVVNDPYIYATSLVYGPEGARDLSGKGVDKKEVTSAFIFGVATPLIVKIPQITAEEAIVKNIGTFSKENKGTDILKDKQAAGLSLRRDNAAAKEIKTISKTVKITDKIISAGTTNVNDSSIPIWAPQDVKNGQKK